MHPIVRALFSSWHLRWDVTLVLATCLTLYLTGWFRLRRLTPQNQQNLNKQNIAKIASKKALAAYLSGIFLIALSLLSPIDALSSQLFFMHMTQHMLMISFATPLLWFGNPFPIVMWALPNPLRKLVTLCLATGSPIRKLLTLCTLPFVSWLIFLIIYIGWHDPTLYNLALYHEGMHDLQHITFFVAALLYWWPVLDGAPHLHKRMPTLARVAYLLAVIPPSMATGIVIATSSTIIYSYYASIPNIWGIDRLYDQAMAGAIMWIPGNEMQVQIAILLLYRWLSKDAKDEREKQKRGHNKPVLANQ